MSDDYTRDPAASASLDELVAMNIAGDIAAVADDLDAIAFGCDVRGLPGCAARLRKIAAGVRNQEASHE